MKKITFRAYEAFLYKEVFKVIERAKDGSIKKTKSIGFCHSDRPKQEDEIYANLSTDITKGKEEITLEIIS